MILVYNFEDALKAVEQLYGEKEEELMWAQGKIEDLEAQLEDAENEVVELAERLNSAQDTIDDLKAQLDNQ